MLQKENGIEKIEWANQRESLSSQVYGQERKNQLKKKEF